MAYKKVYYDEIWHITSESFKKSYAWAEKLQAIQKSQNAFIESPCIKGKAADNIKNYYEEVHGTLLATLIVLCQTYAVKSADYYGGYTSNVDTGDGSDFGLRYTTIVFDEVDSIVGSVPRNVKTLLQQATDVANRANNVKRNISDLVSIYSSPKINDLINELSQAAKKATEVSKNVERYEYTRKRDFSDIDSLISHAKNIISHQLSNGRYEVNTYVSGSIGTATDFSQLNDSLNSCMQTIEDFEKSDHYESAMNLAANRDDIIHEEEKAKREWVKWIAVGVAVVGSIALIVVTAGGATPLVCGAVGAAGGITTAAAKSFSDNYIETGSMTDGMDWSDFTKDCIIGGVTGFIGGYAGASSFGSVVKQPIQKGIEQFTVSVVENAAEGLIDTTWEVGEAIIMGKPGSEVLSVLEEKTSEMMKEIIVEGTTEFVTGSIAGKFDVDSSAKSGLKKFGENTVKNAAESVTKNSLESVWDIGEAYMDPEDTRDFSSILKDEGKEFVKNTASDFVNAEVSDAIGGFSDSFSGSKDGTKIKIVDKILADTTKGTLGAIAGGLTSQSVDIMFGDRDKIDIKEIWDTNLDDGRTIFETAAKSAATNVSKEIYKDESFYNSIKKKDYDNDGNVDVVVFDKYMVLKEDYEAAREVAGKGAYKDQSVQDILGLPKNTAISEKNVKQETISINQLKKSEYKARKTTNVTKMDYKIDYDEVKNNLFDKNLFSDNTAGEYTYAETESGKTASGYLTLGEGKRDKVAQRTVGGADRKSNDEGGHLIGTRFMGSGKSENLDAQNSNVNRVAYYKKEESWEKAIKNGDKVYVHVETHKNNGNDRPTEYMGYAIIEHKDGTRDLDPFVFANKQNATEEEWVVIEKN